MSRVEWISFAMVVISFYVSYLSLKDISKQRDHMREQMLKEYFTGSILVKPRILTLILASSSLIIITALRNTFLDVNIDNVVIAAGLAHVVFFTCTSVNIVHWILYGWNTMTI